jgi:hypothetical protein
MKKNKQPGNTKDEPMETDVMQTNLDDMNMGIIGQDMQRSDQERMMNYKLK